MVDEEKGAGAQIQVINAKNDVINELRSSICLQNALESGMRQSFGFSFNVFRYREERKGRGGIP